MRNLYDTFGLDTPQHLPECPEAATVIASMFLRLGAHLIVDQHGKRQMMLPEPCSARDEEGNLPDPVPNAKPTERFLSSDQYRGALRMVTAMLNRLHPNDTAFVYDAFAIVMADPARVAPAPLDS